MTSRFKSLILMLALVVGASSCGEESTIAQLLDKMSCKVDGVEKNFNFRLTTQNGQLMTIIATTSTSQSSGEQLVLNINGTTPGTYNIAPMSDPLTTAAYRESANDTTANNYVATSGSIVLTQVDATAKTITGTFQFTGYWGASNSVSVTEGRFDQLRYTVTSGGE